MYTDEREGHRSVSLSQPKRCKTWKNFSSDTSARKCTHSHSDFFTVFHTLAAIGTHTRVHIHRYGSNRKEHVCVYCFWHMRIKPIKVQTHINAIQNCVSHRFRFSELAKFMCSYDCIEVTKAKKSSKTFLYIYFESNRRVRKTFVDEWNAFLSHLALLFLRFVFDVLTDPQFSNCYNPLSAICWYHIECEKVTARITNVDWTIFPNSFPFKCLSIIFMIMSCRWCDCFS